MTNNKPKKPEIISLCSECSSVKRSDFKQAHLKSGANPNYCNPYDTEECTHTKLFISISSLTEFLEKNSWKDLQFGTQVVAVNFLNEWLLQTATNEGDK